MADAVVVHGLADLNRAFRNAERSARLEEKKALREIGKPVAQTAEGLAVEKIRNIGSHWPRMRVGTTSKTVYVAPKERGRASRANAQIRRPNLAGLLMDRAMAPALERNRSRIEREVDEFVDRVENVWERT